MITLEGHTNYVTSVAFNSAGMLASGSCDKTIKLWDISTMNCVGTLEGHTNIVASVAFNCAGILASGSRETIIKIWDISTMNCIKTSKKTSKKKDPHRVKSIAFNSAGNILASGSYGDDNIIKIWNIDRMKCVGMLRGHTKWIYSVAFNKDELLASGSADNTIKLWDIATMNCVGTLEGHKIWVYSLVFTPSGLLVSGSHDRTIKLWDTSTMSCVRTLEIDTAIDTIAFNGAGNIMASGGWGVNTINLTPIYTKKFVMTAVLTMNRRRLVEDVIDNIMEKLGVIDKKRKITDCVI